MVFIAEIIFPVIVRYLLGGIGLLIRKGYNMLFKPPKEPKPMFKEFDSALGMEDIANVMLGAVVVFIVVMVSKNANW